MGAISIFPWHDHVQSGCAPSVELLDKKPAVVDEMNEVDKQETPSPNETATAKAPASRPLVDADLSPLINDILILRPIYLDTDLAYNA
jgi:hypothetical protein